MITYRVPANAAGQRLDRFLVKFMPKAGKGLLMKMTRKKRIKLNGRRAAPKDTIQEGDTLTFYFSDETYAKFKGETAGHTPTQNPLPETLSTLIHPPLYEDAQILAVNKPAGLLTQPDHTGDPSVSDLAALFSDGTFHAAPANRLDRGTSGIVLIPKNYDVQKKLLQSIRERKAHKTYLALVFGTVTHSGRCDNRLIREQNKTRISDTEKGTDAALRYRPVQSVNGFTMLEVDLFTGKTHQIRAQLAHIGHPIVGDVKYGSEKSNQTLKTRYHLGHPLLHAAHYTLNTPTLSFDIRAPIDDPAFRVILDALNFNV